MGYFYAATASVILVFIILILQKKDKSRADYLLVAINVLIALFLLADVLVQQQFSSASVILQNVLPLVLIPTFACYVLQFVMTNSWLRKYVLLLYLPGIGLLIYSILDHYILNTYDEAALMEHYHRPDWAYQLFFKGSQLMFIVIIGLLIKGLHSFESHLKDGFSEIETISVSWLKNFAWIYLFAISATFVLFLFQNVGLIPFNIPQIFAMVYGILILAVFYLNINGIKHYTVSQQYVSKDSPGIMNEAPPTSETPGDEAGDTELHQRMIRLIEDEKVYLQPKYGLADLAAALDESTHNVSYVINRIERKSFYDLINGYRVEHLKKLLADPENRKFTVLALGLESGFNSKASVNRIFKNFTDYTPRQYLNKMNQPTD